jgi:superfamily I DNA/RNA helicase
MTYHSIKGLDFRTVFLPLLTPETRFWQEPDIDRRLFFVGATRSRRDLFMSYHGKEPHPYVQNMPEQELHRLEIGRNDGGNDRDGFIF